MSTGGVPLGNLSGRKSFKEREQEILELLLKRTFVREEGGTVGSVGEHEQKGE